MLKILDKLKLKIVAVILAVCCLALFSYMPAFGSASPTPPANVNLGNLGQCPDGMTQFATQIASTPPTGSLYVRLSNTQEAASKVNVYFQSLEDGTCHLLGSVVASYGQWAQVGDFNVSSNNGGFLIVSGNSLGAYPYSSSAKLLDLVGGSGICNLVVNCNVNYDGYSAVVEPTILSKATNQVAVYDISGISGVGYSKVNYFSNGSYLYGGTVLKPINRDYLGGGVNNTDAQITLKDGQILDINQQINTGPDNTGELAVRSWFYRSHDKFLIISIVAVIFVLFWTVLFVARHLYKRHLEKVHHILHDYDPGDNDQLKPPTNQITVG